MAAIPKLENGRWTYKGRPYHYLSDLEKKEFDKFFKVCKLENRSYHA